VLTLLILGIAVIWCHSFTKLTGVEGKYTAADSLSKFLLWFLPFYLLFYLSYIIRSRLRTTRRTSSSTTSSIAPKEARLTVILGITPDEETRLVTILGTTKCRCLYVFTLDLWSCLWLLCCVCMWWILWSFYECVGYYDFWMNVLDLNVYMDILYIMCARFYNSSCADYTVFCKKFIAQTYLLRLRRP
jgi:hypothetical protein